MPSDFIALLSFYLELYFLPPSSKLFINEEFTSLYVVRSQESHFMFKPTVVPVKFVGNSLPPSVLDAANGNFWK